MKRTSHHTLALAALCATIAHGQTTPAPTESESARLETLRKLVKQEPPGRLTVITSPGASAPDCERMLDDLLNRRRFKAIEPMNSNDPDYGGNWRYCGDANAHGDPERAARLFSSFSLFTGGPPFRIYKLPRKIDPHPEADLFFAAQNQPMSYMGYHRGRSFNWVNLNRCEYVGWVGNLAEWHMEENPTGHQVALTQYSGALAVWSVAQSFGFRVKYLLPRRAPGLCQNAGAGRDCLWATIPDDSIIHYGLTPRETR